MKLKSNTESDFSFVDSCPGHTDKFDQSPSEGGAVWCVRGGPQDPTNPQYVQEGKSEGLSPLWGEM